MADEGDVENPSSSGPPADFKEKGALKPISETTPKERITFMVAAIASGTSALAMVMSQGLLVIGAGVCSIGITVYHYKQQTSLTDLAALQETQEAFSAEVDRLAAENQRLSESVADLADTVDDLEDVQNALDTITETQGQSVDSFEEQVAENRALLEQMQKNLKANILQNLLSVIIRSDKDNSMTIEENEIGDVIERIKNINGVMIDEKMFRSTVLKNGGSLQAVMDVVKSLITDAKGGDSEMIKMSD